MFIVVFEFYNYFFFFFFLLEVTFGPLCISKYNSKVILMWGYREKNGLAKRMNISN